MSWLTKSPADRATILRLRPELADAHDRLIEAVWNSPVPAETLELCRLRMAQLLSSERAMAERTESANVAADKLAHLPQWPSDPEFCDDERSCLAFTELFVIDHHAITDEQAGAVRGALGDAGFVAFTTALAVWENQHRLDNALGVQ